MSMSRRHYKAIADTLANARDIAIISGFDETSVNAVLKYVATDLCVVLKRDNANFRRDKFLDACGVEE